MEYDKNLTYEEGPISILDRQVRQLRSKEVPSVKVLWRNHLTEEVIWESEEEMRVICPHLFVTSGMILDSFEDRHYFMWGKHNRATYFNKGLIDKFNQL